MNRTEAWFVHLSTLLVGITGVIYAIMRYLMEPTDPFSVVNHPWQPTLQHLHVLVAPGHRPVVDHLLGGEVHGEQ